MCRHDAGEAQRIDITIIDKISNEVIVIEMSLSWLENREAKDIEKTTKYSQLRLELTKRHFEYKIIQYNIIIDVLGGFSRVVEQNIKDLVGDWSEAITLQMRKTILTCSFILQEHLN